MEDGWSDVGTVRGMDGGREIGCNGSGSLRREMMAFYRRGRLARGSKCFSLGRRCSYWGF